MYYVQEFVVNYDYFKEEYLPSEHIVWHGPFDLTEAKNFVNKNYIPCETNIFLIFTKNQDGEYKYFCD
jgi:hypothetical protein